MTQFGDGLLKDISPAMVEAYKHTAINNWCLAGHDYFRIMAASGHKTLSVFKRYNTVSKEELKALVGEKTGSR